MFYCAYWESLFVAQKFSRRMRRFILQTGFAIFCALWVSFAAPRCTVAQDSQPADSSKPTSATVAQDSDTPTQQTSAGATPASAPEPPDAGSESSDMVTLFPHSVTSRYWISGQANIILEWHGNFRAPYSGTNSFTYPAENATSKVYTLYLGYELTHTTEVYLDVESAGGHGLSNALGLAGFTNLDVVRNPALGDNPYLARLMLRQIIPLSKEHITVERGPLSLATSVPVRRIEFRIGKFTIPDFFDVNSYGSDSHLQFLNWTVDNDGAYDYAANTRGYTDGAILEYDDHWFSARFGVMLMPKVANGIYLDADVAQARGMNLELDAAGSLLLHLPGVVRFLSYRQHRQYGKLRRGQREFSEWRSRHSEHYIHAQARPPQIRLRAEFRARPSGKTGRLRARGMERRPQRVLCVHGRRPHRRDRAFYERRKWRRKNDRAGVVFVASQIVAAHQQYLGYGGLGFLLGDGALTPGTEKIFEGFYTAHLWRGFFVSCDFQHINNPGYNKARGPIFVPGLRFHVDF